MSSKGFFLPNESLFGSGCLNTMGEEIRRKGLNKALLVTGPHVAVSDVMKRVSQVLHENEIEFVVFSGVESNPTVKNVEEGAAMYRDNGCNFLIALGGGSPNDCTKAIGILLSNGGDIHDYQGPDKSAFPSPPIIAINTTAGTASEISRAYLITDEDAKVKMIMKDRNCMAEIAVNDPELMVGLPAKLTASTGMDALTHAVECYVSTKGYPLTRRLAREAADCIFTYLPTAVEQPDNMEAREQMTYGQYMAGMAFGNGGLGLVHSMAHPLGAVFRLGHGISNAVLLPFVCRYNMREAAADYASLSRFLFAEARDMDESEACDLFIARLNELSERIGTRLPLSKLGVTAADIPMLAEKAIQDANWGSNPVKPTVEDIKEIYTQAL